MQIEIHKHLLKTHKSDLELPLDFTFLHFGEQNGSYYLWESHSPETMSTCLRTFHIAPTGKSDIQADFEDTELIHLGSHIANHLTGSFVYHLFMEDPL
jgi:hypothetical protein